MALLETDAEKIQRLLKEIEELNKALEVAQNRVWIGPIG